ncbi:MAG: hypothetical protein ACOYU2_04340 [Nitrospirota bacterium]
MRHIERESEDREYIEQQEIVCMRDNLLKEVLGERKKEHLKRAVEEGRYNYSLLWLMIDPTN